MWFTGRIEPSGPGGKALRAVSAAPGTPRTSMAGSPGLHGMIAPAPGGNASRSSEVIFIAETSVQEVGTITFGDGNPPCFLNTDVNHAPHG